MIRTLSCHLKDRLAHTTIKGKGNQNPTWNYNQLLGKLQKSVNGNKLRLWYYGSLVAFHVVQGWS